MNEDRVNPRGFEGCCRPMPMVPQPGQAIPNSWAGPLPVYQPVRTIGLNDRAAAGAAEIAAMPIARGRG